MSTLTHATKVALFRKGAYLIPIPSVTTSGWNMDDWITFIDNEGLWETSGI